jgi:hypothetical protein
MAQALQGARVNNRARIIVIALAGVIIIALTVALGSRLELVHEEFIRPPALEARQNPALAASRFLNAAGISTQAVDSLDKLPGTDHVLILMPRELAISSKVGSDLAQWVRDGGHLVIAPCDGEGWNKSGSGGTLLLHQLQISVDCFDGKIDWDLEPGSESYEMDPVQISFDDPPEDLRVGMPWIELNARLEDAVIERELGPSRSLSIGDGTASVLGSMAPFTNGRINRDDNARFLERLVSLNGKPTGVRLIYGARYSGIFEILWARAWPLLVAFGLALAAFLARSMVRTGTKIPVETPGSRSLLDHINAIGVLLWKADREILYEAVRAETLHAVSTRRPDLISGGNQQLETVRRERLGEVPANAIARVLGSPAPSTRDEFTRAVRRLDSIRRAL